MTDKTDAAKKAEARLKASLSGRIKHLTKEQALKDIQPKRKGK